MNNEGESIEQEKYARIIKSLIYLMNYIEPHIAYTMGKLSRFTSNSSADHWREIKSY